MLGKQIYDESFIIYKRYVTLSLIDIISKGTLRNEKLEKFHPPQFEH